MARWLRLVGILILAYLLAFRVDLGKLGALLRSANPWLVAAAAALNAPAIVVKSERWRLLLRAQGVRYRAIDALKAFIASQYVGIVTPGRVGDLTRVVYLRRDAELSLAAAAPSVIADRLLDLYFLLGVGLLACARFSVRFSVLGLAGVAMVAALPVLVLVPGFMQRLDRLGFVRRILRRFGRAGGGGDGADAARASLEFAAAARSLVSWRLAGAFALTVLGYLGTFLQVWVLARALGIGVSFVDLSLMTAVANLVALLPISISGIGTRDATLKFLFARVGAPPDAGIALSLAILFAAWVVMAVVGFAAFELWPPPARVTAPRDAGGQAAAEEAAR